MVQKQPTTTDREVIPEVVAEEEVHTEPEEETTPDPETGRPEGGPDLQDTEPVSKGGLKQDSPTSRSKCNTIREESLIKQAYNKSWTKTHDTCLFTGPEARKLPTVFATAATAQPDATADSESAIAADLTRKQRWHSLCQAIALTLPVPPAPETPAKVRNKERKRVEDRSDPEQAEAPPALPLHRAITRAMDCLREDIPSPQDKGGIKIQRKPLDTTYVPKGQRYWTQAAEVGERLGDLHEGKMPVHTNYQVVPEKDYKAKEQMLRNLICYASSRRWVEDALFMAMEVMMTNPKDTVDNWALTLKGMMLAMHSISVVEIDTLTTELANVILMRRDGWIKAMKPELSRDLAKELRTASFLEDGLFGEITQQMINSEQERRKDAALRKAVEQRVQPQVVVLQQETGKRPVTPSAQAGPPPKRSSHKKSNGKGGKAQTQQQQQQQSQQGPQQPAAAAAGPTQGKSRGKGFKGKPRKPPTNK